MMRRHTLALIVVALSVLAAAALQRAPASNSLIGIQVLPEQQAILLQVPVGSTVQPVSDGLRVCAEWDATRQRFYGCVTAGELRRQALRERQ